MRSEKIRDHTYDRLRYEFATVAYDCRNNKKIIIITNNKMFIKHKSLQLLLECVAAFLVSTGRLFHRRGAATLKARSLNRSRARGTTRSLFVTDHRSVTCRWSVATGCNMGAATLHRATLKVGFHYPSSRPEFTGRVDTRPVNSGSGNRP